MPIYEYNCPSCGHEFEAILRFSDPTPPCPRCDAAPEKKMSRSAFHLKGAGWYKDAYSGKDNTKPASTDPAPAAEAPAKVEATPAAAPAPAASPAPTPATPTTS